MIIPVSSEGHGPAVKGTDLNDIARRIAMKFGFGECGAEYDNVDT